MAPTLYALCGLPFAGKSIIARELGRLHLAETELGQGDLDSAQRTLEESVINWREIGERRHLAFAIADLAVGDAWQRRFAVARAQLGEALSTFTDLQDWGGTTNALFNCSRLFMAEGAHQQSACVTGAFDAAVISSGAQYLWPCFERLIQRRLQLARQAVGSELVSAAFAEGHAMSLNAAVAYARHQLGVSTG